MKTDEIVYRITKERCEAMIMPDTCCSSCGGELKAIETVDNSNNPTYWLGCPDVCGVFDNGCPKEVYAIANEMVENRNYVHYDTENREQHPEYWKQSQKRGVTGLIRQVFQIQNELKKS